MLSESSESEQEDEVVSEIPSPGQLWRRSESPEESFSDAEGADADGKWPVQIIGEEVDGEGEIRYEARWENWSRPDGSNITWNNDLLDPGDIRIWESSQRKKRNALAKESQDITIWASLDIHNFETRLRAQAYEEKLRVRKRSPLNLRERMEKLLAEKRAGMEVDSPPGSPAGSPQPARSKRNLSPDVQTPVASPSKPQRSDTPVSYNPPSAKRPRTNTGFVQPVASSSRAPPDPASVSSSTRSRARALDSPVSSSQRSSTLFSTGRASSITSISTLSPAAPKGKGKGKAREVSGLHSPMAAAQSGMRVLRSLPSRSRTPVSRLSRREALERDWAIATQSCRAAGVTIVNELDDEEVPSLPPNFQYLESGYIYSKGVPGIVDEDVFVRCDCNHCVSPTDCSCQEPSELIDEDDNKRSAYTSDGLFAFIVPPGVEVIECNRYCQCDPYTCPNRVAQQPRDIPIEIFKTTNRGWGARSPVDIQCGKVLGMFAGIILRRESSSASQYCFDLDTNEDPDAETSVDAYSVDSKKCGNWTRFVNHSCEPNLIIYPVVYDTIPGTNTPYLAFVAKENILAGTELVLDYNPGAAEVKTKGKGKGKVTKPPGARDCMCGAGRCRGWVSI